MPDPSESQSGALKRLGRVLRVGWAWLDELADGSERADCVELMRIAHDWRYSDEYLGSLFRAMFGRSSTPPSPLVGADEETADG